MTVKDIIIEYLKNNGYDGLYNRWGQCACLIDDLVPCCGGIDECEPGYVHKSDCICKNCRHLALEFEGEDSDWIMLSEPVVREDTE